MGFHSLSIGSSALLTAQYGLNVTGQNLGNVNTPGYSRQVVKQNGIVGSTSLGKNSILGAGVNVTTVTRIGSEYMEKQLRQSYSTDNYYGELEYTYSYLNAAMNELSSDILTGTAGNALSDSMNSFWQAMGDFTTKAEQLPIRTTTLKEAEQLCSRFNKIGDQLSQYRQDVDGEIRQSVGQINDILDGIAALNSQIVSAELGGVTGRTANDLRDQRGELVKDLYGFMDVDVLEEDNGSYIVSFHGRTLVYLDQVKSIEMVKTSSPDGTLVHTPVFSEDKYPLRPSDGVLAAQMEARDTIIPSYQKEIDSLAGNFIWEFNRIHSQGRGMESFDSLTSANGPSNPEATLDKLQFPGSNFPEGTFKVVNGELNFIIHNRETNEPMNVRLEIDVDGRLNPDGEPDMILYDFDNPDASNSFINRLQKAIDEKLPGVFEVTIDRHNQVSITSNSDEYGFSFGKDTSGILAVLGLNTFFTGHNAQTMGVNPVLTDNPAYLAGSSNFEEGNNDNAVALLALQDKVLGNLGGQTLEDYYLSITGRLGSESSKTSNMKKLSCDIYNRMFNQRESLSGVNEDEEVTKLITYQRSYQTAAKFISTVDQMYETLLNM